MKALSKSSYTVGLQCYKYLWTLINKRDKIPEFDKATEQRFEQGQEVGELAKTLFPGGVDIPNHENFEENIKLTKKLLKKHKPLYEAGILVKNIYARADILKPVNKNKWDVIEVKSSTKVKDEHIDDVAFQKHVYEKSGLKIRKCFLMHLNKEYVKKGKINPKKLFIIEEITSRVNESIKDVPDNVKEMLKIIKLNKCPKIIIGKWCNKPYACPLFAECEKDYPKAHILKLYGRKPYELLEDGIYAIKNIPEEVKLSVPQQIQCKCEKTKKPYIDKEGIKQFLKTLKYPLYYLDFETFSTAIPIYDGTSPWQEIPFQFSLHVVKSKNSQPKHYSFLAKNSDDPRLELLSSLQKVLGKKGSIVVFNKTFERKILKKLGEAYPKHEKWVEAVINRIVDLWDPFRKFYYYDPLQLGSTSLKGILPILTGKGYEKLSITNGGDASITFMEIAFNDVPDKQKKKVREDLEKYCGLDTEGMIWIVDELRKLVK